MEAKILKRYWIQDIRSDEELVLTAISKKDVSEKTKIPIKFIRIMRVYHRKNLKDNSLILNY